MGVHIKSGDGSELWFDAGQVVTNLHRTVQKSQHFITPHIFSTLAYYHCLSSIFKKKRSKKQQCCEISHKICFRNKTIIIIQL